MNNFFYIERVQMWINIHQIVTISRVSDQWRLAMQDKSNVILNDAEYAELTPKLNEPPHKPEEKKTEE